MILVSRSIPHLWWEFHFETKLWSTFSIVQCCFHVCRHSDDQYFVLSNSNNISRKTQANHDSTTKSWFKKIDIYNIYYMLVRGGTCSFPLPRLDHLPRIIMGFCITRNQGPFCWKTRPVGGWPSFQIRILLHMLCLLLLECLSNSLLAVLLLTPFCCKKLLWLSLLNYCLLLYSYYQTVSKYLMWNYCLKMMKE